MYNHIGSFAASAEAICRSIFLGSVTRRHPELAFAFLEGGVGYACSLFADLLSHWEKRNAVAIRSLDPAALDLDELCKLMAAYGSSQVRGKLPAIEAWLAEGEPPPESLHLRECRALLRQARRDVLRRNARCGRSEQASGEPLTSARRFRNHVRAARDRAQPRGLRRASRDQSTD